jgi:23S rRNA pseudouridine1911/1915/1917 synthase
MTYIVTTDLQGQRLDVGLTLINPTISRAFFQKLIEMGNVTINGLPITKTAYTLQPGMVITYTVPPIPTTTINFKETNTINVKIIFEHEDFLILDKPAELTVHEPHTNHQEPTLINWLVNNVTAFADNFDQELNNPTDQQKFHRPGIVHRLDKNTSGIIIVAKNPFAHATLSSLFAQRVVQKTYRAIAQGITPLSGSIDYPIARCPNNQIKMSHRFANGKPALTEFTTLGHNKNYSLVELYPHTGRTHQLRVHLSALGYPILGDELYGTTSKIITRQALHAYRITFTYNTINYSFESCLPKDFTDALHTCFASDTDIIKRYASSTI